MRFWVFFIEKAQYKYWILLLLLLLLLLMHENAYPYMKMWIIYMKWIIYELQKWNQVKGDPQSCERNLCNCVNKPEKIHNFNWVWTSDLTIPVWYPNQLSYNSPWERVKWLHSSVGKSIGLVSRDHRLKEGPLYFFVKHDWDYFFSWNVI